MHSEQALPPSAWIKSLPSSRMVFPQSWQDRSKYLIWRLYTPLHPFVRDIGLWLRIVTHVERQKFSLGNIAPRYTIKEVISYLVTQGYGNHFIAWKDVGEVISLRRVEGFEYQYHIRVFKDGEVRGHYEYTPESHPILHLRDTDIQARKEEFLALLGDRIIPSLRE